MAESVIKAARAKKKRKPPAPIKEGLGAKIIRSLFQSATQPTKPKK
jgi:hypothetical protein